jgi:hypothetical protein
MGARLMKITLALALMATLWVSGPAMAAAPGIVFTPRAELALTSGRAPYLAEAERILNAVAKVRRLPVKQPIKVDVLGREELFRHLKTQIDKEIKPEQIVGEKALYVRWGMLAPDFDYGAFLLDLYTEQVGGFYDPETQMLYLVEGAPLARLDMEVLIAHELTHALQDQHYQLRDFMGDSSDDQTLARQALVEGDAVVTSIEYVQQRMQQRPMFWDTMASLMNVFRMQGSFAKLKQAPGFVKSFLLFPYEEGQTFVSSLRASRDWDDFVAIYKQPPSSTEHILHPATFLAADHPQTLTLKLPQPGYHKLLSGVLGEMTLQLLFRHHLPLSEARQAARGWKGDYYEILERQGHTVLQLLTAWDSPADAQEFCQAYRQVIQLRYPGLAAQVDGANERYTLKTGEHLLLRCQGSQVAIAEGHRAPVTFP